ncbi:retropepsin-like aspartic protease [Prevotella dentasini]|uniref:retropepsin-like aspartic protease n=1 Tax=Prevotella dentasini TaxID=589537 RepID=UPI0009FBB554|nr:retropepsin-like aspartic protease [Prevotella dentasini]
MTKKHLSSATPSARVHRATRAFLVCLLFVLALPGFSSTGPRSAIADTIPVRFVGHRILVPVRIGQKAATFVFDTGCTHTLLFDFRRFDVVPQRWLEAADVNGQVSKVLTCRIPEMQIGRQIIRDSIAITSPFGIVADLMINAAGIDGCIGMDFLAGGKAVKMDMRNQCIIVTDHPGMFQNEPGIVIPFTPRSLCPSVYISPFKGIGTKAIFDTGSAPFLLIGNDIVSQIKAHRNMPKDVLRQTVDRSVGSNSSGIFGSSGLSELFLYRLEAFSLGRLVFEDIYAYTANATRSRIGSELLDYASVVLDYSNHTLRLQPYAPYKPADSRIARKQQACRSILPAFPHYEYFLQIADSTCLVTNVWPRSSAYAAGLRTGYRLTAMDGRQDSLPERYFHVRHLEESGHSFTFSSDHRPAVTITR